MKILYVTTVGITMTFFRSYIRQLLDEGHTVEIATNESETPIPECYREWGCAVHPISTSRSPFSAGNLKAVRQLRRLTAENRYDIVHCHTPLAAMCTRLACKKARRQYGARVLYTAHGFHFYKGAPLKNWLIYYPIERICSRWTDVLITINGEDYALAKKMKAKQVAYVPGVGIDVDRFRSVSVDRGEKRRELGIPEDAFLLASVGELNENKNHQVVIRAMAAISRADVHYAIAGVGESKDSLTALAKELGLEERVHLLGYRRDVDELFHCADLMVHPSIREGLPVAVMEGMACGLPLLCSRIRGNTDLVDASGGMLFDPTSVSQCKEALERMMTADLKAMGRVNLERVKQFSIGEINQRMYQLYCNANCDANCSAK